jgi:hypothetical protein
MAPVANSVTFTRSAAAVALSVLAPVLTVKQGNPVAQDQVVPVEIRQNR